MFALVTNTNDDDDDTWNTTIMLLPPTCAHITTYTPYCEPSLPSSLRPTIYYLTVDGPVDQVVGAPVPWLAPLLDLVQVVQAQQNGRALPYLTESVVVQERL